MLEALVKNVEKQNLNVHGIEVCYKGEYYSHYFHENKPYPIYSATKTFVSAAVGIAQGEGRFNADECLYKYLDDKSLGFVPKDQLESFKKLTVKRFLTMSVEGYPFRPEGNYLEYSLSYTVDYSKKPVFSYSNISAYLVGVAVENAVDRHLADYLKPRLFEPLGIDSVMYKNSPEGRFYGASGMELTVSHLGLLGRLYLQKGSWQGKELMPECWAEQSSSLQINNIDGGYGYFIWINGESFRISGKWGQKSLVYPKKDLVITYLSDLPDSADRMLKLAENFANDL